MGILLIVGFAVVIAAILAAGVYLAYAKGRRARIEEISHRRLQLIHTDVHAWFDPDFKDEWGASLYEMEDGGEKEVTMVSDNVHQMRHRKYGSKTVYLGKVKKFIRREGLTSHDLFEHFPPNLFVEFMEDIAMLAFLSVDFWEEYYPVDMSCEDPSEGISEETFATSVVESIEEPVSAMN